MNTKIMEGLVGAGTNMQLTDTTMRVYRDARRRGDLDVMERAMEYTGDFTQRAGEYQETAREGMEEEAVEVREKREAQMAEAIQKRKEEQKEQEERLTGSEARADTVELSEEGKAAAGMKSEGTGTSGSGGQAVDNLEPVFYDSTGAVSAAGQQTGVKVSVEG